MEIASITTTFNYKAVNQMASDGTYTYVYDNNGNLIQKTWGSAVINAYIWDRANRLLSLNTIGDKYDGDDTRYRQTVGSTVTNYPLAARSDWRGC